MTMTMAMTTQGDAVAELIAIEANRRELLHAGHASSRPLSKGYEVVGMSGEFEFGKFCGLMPDLTSKPKGDSGVDFTVPLHFTVDVKTSRKAENLMHEQGKPFADIYVLAKYDDETRTSQLVGWEWGRNLKATTPKDCGHGVINHTIPRDKLRKMDELKRLIKRAGY